jgi:thiol:disulfide interchange protein DsbD
LFRNFILTILCSISFASALQFPGAQASNFATTFIDSTAQEEFLPVEAAYQLNVEVEADQLQLIWQIADHYYLYGHRFSFELLQNDKAITISPTLPKGIEKTDEYFGEVEVYYQQVIATIPLPKNTGSDSPLLLNVSSQGCADAGLCYPPYRQSFTIDRTQLTASAHEALNPAQARPVTPVNTNNAPAKKSYSFIYILILAALGGAILNLMPCVFPILSLKVLSFTGKDPGKAHTRMHGIVYTAGIMISFVIVAAILLLLRAGGEAIGWGFQLQSPWFVAALTYLFFVMGLALSGMLEIGSRFMGIGGSLANQSGYSGSFFTGVLATVVASPCTAPFMGTALGYAMTQAPVAALSIFAALGFGMALPFLILSEIPALTNKLPKPGPWMDSFKRFMAFPLFATCVWLLWVIGNQTSPTGMALVLLGCVLIALAVYLWHEQTSKRHWSIIKNIVSIAATVLALSLLGSTLLQAQTKASYSASDADWETYSAQRLNTLRTQGKPVFINVTADWCITCLANERLTLSTEDVKQAFKQHNIHYLKADWTNHDPAITELLRQYDRSGIPLYLLYPADGEQSVRILPQLLTVEIVKSSLEELATTGIDNT